MLLILCGTHFVVFVRIGVRARAYAFAAVLVVPRGRGPIVLVGPWSPIPR